MDDIKVIDARGSFCPGPLMELIKGIRQEAVGTVFEIWSSDAGSAKDIPEWVARAGHEVVQNREEDGIYKVQVKKVR
ncbi:sulfurtransferase TusA family protein [Sulfobacillus sp. hq2]|uniref:sulfurtransferase TusA family protein n=1 Tax=Sulfobacillus TaxID=28033 RepID=UPI001FA867CA|nr:sulfurtransferase TusA family protein [Sulfobacillus sp. hq2]MCY0909417.1 sulfurtransferase TusA family protein [Sulfobacillus thermotolerans]